MAKILVSGLINIETTLKIDGFPLHYNPVNYPFFGVNSTVSGVGYNVTKALATLGNKVMFLSMIGQDLAAQHVKTALKADRLNGEHVLQTLSQTPQSVILYNGNNGQRQIHVDLKDIQEQPYPIERFEQAAANCDVLALCNINFSRPMLFKAKEAGKLIATDVHAVSNLDDDYNRDFMAAADILFMSDEWLPTNAEDWAEQVMNRYAPEVLVIGLGNKGALLGLKNRHSLEYISPVHTRPVVNTIGAGDALFSAFIHCYAQSGDPYKAIKKAVVFASYKIGAVSAADGFLSNQALTALYLQTQ